MAYTDSTTLAYAVGGGAILVQLLDKDGDGVADSALVTDVIAQADAEVNSAIQVAVQLPLSSTPDTVKYAATAIAAFIAWERGTSAQGIPPEVKASYDRWLRWLDDVATRKRTLGAATKPATDHQVEQVNVESYAADTHIRDSLKGFW